MDTSKWCLYMFRCFSRFHANMWCEYVSSLGMEGIATIRSGCPPEPEVLVLFLGGLDFVAEAFNALAVGVFGLAIA